MAPNGAGLAAAIGVWMGGQCKVLWDARMMPENCSQSTSLPFAVHTFQRPPKMQFCPVQKRDNPYVKGELVFSFIWQKWQDEQASRPREAAVARPG